MLGQESGREMKVLIFGGTRFMGRYLLNSLLSIGAEVTVANRGNNPPNEGSTNVICDRSQPDALDQFKDAQFDVIVDFSAYSSEWVAAAGKFFANKISKYVFISSGAVYSNSDVFPITEDFPLGPPHPFAPYASEKLKSERLLVEFSKSGYFHTVSCRLPFVLGPHNYEDRESFVFSRLMRNEPILLANGGQSVHPFVYAGDVAGAILALIKAGASVNGESFNVASPQGVTSSGFVNIAAKVCSKEAKIISYSPAEFDLDVNDFDLKNVTFPFPAMNALLSSEKLTRMTGFRPKENLESMFRIYFDWWKGLDNQGPKEYPLERRLLAEMGK